MTTGAHPRMGGPTGRLLFLLDWDPASTSAWKERLEAADWQVEAESEDGGRAYRRIRELAPAALVVDLSSKPSHGRETVRSLMEGKATCAISVVAVGGAEPDRRAIRAIAPHAVFCEGEQLLGVLRRTLASKKGG